jgi:hypothetical protein
MRMKLIVAALAAAAAAVSVTGTSAAATTVPLSGTQTVFDEAKGIYQMHGSLVGTWYTTSFVPRYKSASPFVATGTEKFVGCIDSNRSAACDAGEPSGTLKLTFVYWGDYNPRTKALLRAACVHPIVGGSGSFARASGVFFMKDTPVGKTIRTTYHGKLDYGPTAAMRTLSSVSAGAC